MSVLLRGVRLYGEGDRVDVSAEYERTGIAPPVPDAPA